MWADQRESQDEATGRGERQERPYAGAADALGSEDEEQRYERGATEQRPCDFRRSDPVERGQGRKQ
ncbi:MAG TPA: hypothetical protein VD838_11230, partial [Anaeromyxobacteraceae bacterium]|nr:hypothetical protein [Anaeromyxobacteraceae bacterium]